MKEERINEIWAVLLLCIAVIVFVSLFSFDHADLPFYTSDTNSPVKNFAGVAGAYLAGGLIFIIGRASFILPLLMLLWAVGKFMGKSMEKFYLKLLGAAVLIAAASSLLSMISRRDSVAAFSNGGIIGLGFSSFLMKYFGVVGSYIIVISLLALSFLLATEFLLFPLAVALYSRLKVLFTGARALMANLKKGLPKPKARAEKKVFRPVRPAPQEVARETAEEPVIRKRTVLKLARKEPKEATKIKEGTSRPLEKKEYILPSLELLDSPPPIEERRLNEDLETSSKILEETLADFGVEVKIAKIEQGPVITRYELEPAPGIKISRISALSDNIALAMKAESIRVVAPIPGKGTVGVEVPNSKTALVYLKEVLESKDFQDSGSKLTMALGKDISGHPIMADLSDMPHLLIAGATGSGKTVCVNSLVASLLFNATPEELKFLMVDPKMVELSIYNNIPHLLCPVVTEHKKVSAALNWIVNEMESRYKLFAETGSRNIDIYNQKIKEEERIPYIVVIIDELADLMAVAQQDIENAITRLAQLSRAVGIHIVLATQRPSVDVITGVIKANFPARISFKVASKVDSRTVLDMNGADKLLGKGDMLFIEPGASRPTRAQGSLVSDPEIEKIVDFIKGQRDPEYNIDILKEAKKIKLKTFEKDEVYDEAVRLVLQTRQASVSMLQRRLGLGYTRSARLIDMMEDEGIVGPYAGSKPRQILVDVDKYAREKSEG